MCVVASIWASLRAVSGSCKYSRPPANTMMCHGGHWAFGQSSNSLWPSDTIQSLGQQWIVASAIIILCRNLWRFMLTYEYLGMLYYAWITVNIGSVPNHYWNQCHQLGRHLETWFSEIETIKSIFFSVEISLVLWYGVVFPTARHVTSPDLIPCNSVRNGFHPFICWLRESPRRFDNTWYSQVLL